MTHKKVLFYVGNLAKGGAQRVILNLTEMLLTEGNQVVIVTPRQEEEEYALPQGAVRLQSELTDTEAKQGAVGRVCNLFARVRKLRRILRAERPDLLVSFLGKNNLMAVAASRGLKLPVAVSVRGTPSREYAGAGMRFLAGVLFRMADGVILQTPDAKAFFPAGVQKKAVILPNPLSPAFCRPRFEGARRKEIVTVGRIDANKDQALLVDAFLAIAEKFPSVRLVLYGNGEDRQKLQERVDRAGMQERIELPGAVADVADRIEKARIFVLPSRTEGMPNALMEAMALGLAVIATDCPCGGPRMLIRDGENGLLVPVGDKEALAAALERLLSDRGLEERLGRAAAKLQETLRPEAVQREWLSYLESRLRA